MYCPLRYNPAWSAMGAESDRLDVLVALVTPFEFAATATVLEPSSPFGDPINRFDRQL